MKTKIIIPKLCKVGFQLRRDTFTGKLGYVIYNDGKTWRKEPSWNSWRTKENTPIREYNREKKEYEIKGYITDVEPIEFNNDPIEGFVLNKKVGDYVSDWNHRKSYCRVYDPRGFEFEIGIPNLLYILENTNSIKGKGLEGKFVYGWDGKDLVLIPENAPEYKEMQEYTDIQSLKVKKSELILGGKYILSDNEIYTYLGYHKYFEYHSFKSKKLVFAEMNGDKVHFYNKNINNVKKFVDLDDNYVFLLDKMHKNHYYNFPEFERITNIDQIDQKECDNYWGFIVYDDIDTKKETCVQNKIIKHNRYEDYWNRTVVGHYYELSNRNTNSITYKTLEQLIQENELWLPIKTTN